MNSNALITKKTSLNTFRSVLCFQDGSPSQAGATLAAHYTDTAKVDALLDDGHVLQLGTAVASCTHLPAWQRIEEPEAVDQDDIDDVVQMAQENGCTHIYVHDAGAWDTLCLE